MHEKGMNRGAEDVTSEAGQELKRRGAMEQVLKTFFLQGVHTREGKKVFVSRAPSSASYPSFYLFLPRSPWPGPASRGEGRLRATWRKDLGSEGGNEAPGSRRNRSYGHVLKPTARASSASHGSLPLALGPPVSEDMVMVCECPRFLMTRFFLVFFFPPQSSQISVASQSL